MTVNKFRKIPILCAGSSSQKLHIYGSFRSCVKMQQQTCFSLPTLLHNLLPRLDVTSHTCSIVSQLSFAIVFWTCCLVFSGSLMLLVWGVSATILGFAFSCNLRYSAQIGLYIQCKQYPQYALQNLQSTHNRHKTHSRHTDTTKI